MYLCLFWILSNPTLAIQHYVKTDKVYQWFLMGLLLKVTLNTIIHNLFWIQVWHKSHGVAIKNLYLYLLLMKRYLTYNFHLNIYIYFLSCATFFVEFFSFIWSLLLVQSNILSIVHYQCQICIMDFWKENLSCHWMV